MGTGPAQLVLDQIFYKQQGPIIATPWHQDTPFLRVRGSSLVRLWMPCDLSPPEVTVQVVRGSHRWNVVFSTAIPAAPNLAGRTSNTEQGIMATGDGLVGDAGLPPPPDVARYRDSFDILRWSVAPGDVLAFQGNMLHGADSHPGHDRPRRAFAVLMGGPDLAYYRPSGKAFPSPGQAAGTAKDEDIPNGAPIGEHLRAFPPC